MQKVSRRPKFVTLAFCMWTIIDIYGTINKEKLDLIKAKRNGLSGLEPDLKQGLESALPKPVKLDVLKRINNFI